MLGNHTQSLQCTTVFVYAPRMLIMSHRECLKRLLVYYSPNVLTVCRFAYSVLALVYNAEHCHGGMSCSYSTLLQLRCIDPSISCYAIFYLQVSSGSPDHRWYPQHHIV